MKPSWSWTTPAAAAAASASYWKRRSFADRLAAVELARRATPGSYGEATPRLERLSRLVVASSGEVLAGRGTRGGGSRAATRDARSRRVRGTIAGERPSHRRRAR